MQSLLPLASTVLLTVASSLVCEATRINGEVMSVYPSSSASPYEAILHFANVTGTSPRRLEEEFSPEAKTLKLLEAFGFEGRPENFPGLIKNRPDLVRAMENWVDTLPGGPKSSSSSQQQLGESWFQISQAPEQIHIALTRSLDKFNMANGGAHNNISVLWTTNSTTGNTCVCWWPEENSNNNNNNSSSKKKTCTRGGNQTSWTFDPSSVIPWKGWIHGGFITDEEIVPNGRYCYSVGGCTPETTSTGNHCFTAPNTASPIDQQQQQEEYLFALGGDMGSYQLVGHLMAKQMRDDEISNNLRFDAFWHLGDISYSTVSPPHWNFEFFWDVYMRQEESFADHVPMLVTYGNHDVGGGDSASYLNRFFNPHDYAVTNTTAAGAASTGSFGNHNPFYWSYEHGPIKYVSMCTEPEMNPVRCDYAPGSTQYQWLEKELSSINRTRTPWLVLAGHRPMYSSDRGTDSGPLRKFIEPLLVKYQVDVELAGHMHETEVIAPVVDKKVNLTGVIFNGTITGSGEPAGVNNSFIFNQPSQPVHLTMGTLGAVIDEHWVEPRPEWSLFHKGTLFDDAYGYVQLRATMTKLNFKFKRQMNNSTLWELEIRK